MRFFLAVLTVTAIGIVLSGSIIVAPMGAIIIAIWGYWKAAGYEEDLKKEYEEYKRAYKQKVDKRYAEDFLRAKQNYKPHLFNIKVPTWFNQEKYRDTLFENRETIQERTVNSIVKNERFISAFYEIPIITDNELYYRTMEFGTCLHVLYKLNPEDETIIEYIQKFHNFDFDEWVYLENKFHEPDKPEYKYLSLEEFRPNSRAAEERKANLIGATLTMIAGIIVLFALTIPLLTVNNI